MLRVRTSRRVSGLEPSDYDHEIGLINRDESSHPSPSHASAEVSRVSTTNSALSPSINLTAEDAVRAASSGDNAATNQAPFRAQQPDQSSEELERRQDLPHPALQPSIEVQMPTPDIYHESNPVVVPKTPHTERETAIDILYENERGGFLCGVALFSGAALGSLDPAPWTNAYHKPSPTSIHTAQVPDPSWEWLWPDWHINQQEGVDGEGWEYSFAFSRKFSWHGPRWWNSFVRRRAWTRKRTRKHPENISSDPHLLNTEYFSIRPATHSVKSSRDSLTSGKTTSRASRSLASVHEVEEEIDIEDIDTLLSMLRRARIDREKLDAVDKYLEHAVDLSALQGAMHELMSLFVFQASRKILLSRLMAVYDEVTQQTSAQDGKENDDEDGRRKARQDALEAAVHHADEEVRKLAYWSDVKRMTEDGEVPGAVDEKHGWYDAWQGVDQSGPIEPNGGRLPKS